MNAVRLREQETKRLKVESVQLRSFGEDRTAVGRIAFNDERTTSIFAAFQGRVVRLIAKPGDVIGGGAPEVMTTSLDRADGDGRLPAGRDGVLRDQKLTDIGNIVLGSQPGGIPILIRDVE